VASRSAAAASGASNCPKVEEYLERTYAETDARLDTHADELTAARTDTGAVTLRLSCGHR
jgi:hypothetical protein